MTGSLPLDWLALTLSLFNTIILCWLGLTVWLNAERRTAGIALAVSGLLAGCVFFISHTAILGRGLYVVGRDIEIWWHLGWAPVILLPWGWYTVILWYTGFWDDPHGALRRRQLPWFCLATGMALGLAALLITTNSLPTYTQVVVFNLASPDGLSNLPLVIALYLPYTLVCLGLPLDALLHPGPSGRLMGELARERARPWLAASTLLLLSAGVLVSAFLFWLLFAAQQRAQGVAIPSLLIPLVEFDALVDGLVGLTIVLIGQAIVSYEVFTGKALPRRGLQTQWYGALALAAGGGAVAAAGLLVPVRPLYVLLLSALLVAAFSALMNWRAQSEREHTLAQLRPFVTSQRLYEGLTEISGSAALDVRTPFFALCQAVLDARQATLIPLGPLGPLAGAPLHYPHATAPTLPALADLTAQMTSPQMTGVALDPARWGGALWAVPLWSERGLIGALLLGPKSSGGLYTQEEIEIARATGERLIDTQAGVEIAQRLMALQRQRHAERQLLDQQARRTLHDDILPRLHTALLALSAHTSAPPEATAQLTTAHREISDLLHALPAPAAQDVLRLGLLAALQRAYQDELTESFDSVTWDFSPAAEQHAPHLPARTAEALFYAAREAMRNAARHARGGQARPLHLRVTAATRASPAAARPAVSGVSGMPTFTLTIADDGVGLTGAAPASRNSGQGLALHSTLLAVVGATLSLESTPAQGVRVVLQAPE